MKQSINFYQFCDAFRGMDRNDNFSYQGKKALFEALEQNEEDTGEELELDVIALCCDYSELTLEDINREYSNMLEDGPIETLEEATEWLQDQTWVIPVQRSACDEAEGSANQNSVIIQVF